MIVLLTLGIVTFIFLYINEIRIFDVDARKTILLLWTQVQFFSILIQGFYYWLKLKMLLKNKELKKENYRDPSIRQAINDDTNFQRQIDEMKAEKSMNALRRGQTAHSLIGSPMMTNASRQLSGRLGEDHSRLTATQKFRAQRTAARTLTTAKRAQSNNDIGQ